MSASAKKKQVTVTPTPAKEEKKKGVEFTPMIVKVQRPVAEMGAFGDTTPRVLIYDEKRTFEQMWPMTPALAALFKKDQFKVYCNARYFPASGYLSVDDVVADEKW